MNQRNTVSKTSATHEECVVVLLLIAILSFNSLLSNALNVNDIVFSALQSKYELNRIGIER